MSRIEQLPEVTEQVLSGLQAGDELKNRIYRKALEPDSVPSRRSIRVPMIALCSLSVVMIALVAVLGQVHSLNDSDAADIRTITAGARRIESPVILQNIIDETVSQYAAAAGSVIPEENEEAVPESEEADPAEENDEAAESADPAAVSVPKGTN